MSILLSCLIQFAEAWIVFIFDERWSIFVQIINLFESFLGDCTRDLLSFDDWFRKYILIFSVYRQLVDFSFTAWPLKSSADCWKIRMPESVVIEVPVKSPVQGTKSPAQVRLESRANEPRSPLSPAALKQNLENAELNRKNLLMARAEKCRDNYSKAKEVSITQKEAFNEKTNLQAESIQNRLVSSIFSLSVAQLFAGCCRSQPVGSDWEVPWANQSYEPEGSRGSEEARGADRIGKRRAG